MDDQILELVKLLKLDKYHIKGNEIKTLCLNPLHDDKHLGNFSINLNNGLFNCFACGYHGNIVYLLSENGTRYTKAIRIWNQLRKVKELYVPAMPVDKYIIAAYKQNGISQYAQERVQSDFVLKEYEVYSDNWGNPIFLTKNNRGQYNSVWVRENGKYFLIEPLTARRDGVLYGINLAPSNYTVLTEGPFDAIAIRKYTGMRGICGFGTFLSSSQLCILRNINNLVIMMDGDNAGRLARQRLLKQMPEKSDLYLAGGYLVDPDELREQLVDIIKKVRPSWEYNLSEINNNKKS